MHPRRASIVRFSSLRDDSIERIRESVSSTVRRSMRSMRSIHHAIVLGRSRQRRKRDGGIARLESPHCEGNERSGESTRSSNAVRLTSTSVYGDEMKQKMGKTKNLIVTILRLVPLGLYVRSAACKYAIPILGCDGALCPVAIGKPGNCAPSANTAEQYAWCEHAWTPWANGLLTTMRVPVQMKCSKANGYEFAKVIGALELAGYVALWVKPAQGAFLLSVIMAGAIHFHMTKLGDTIDKVVLQFALLGASLAIMFLTSTSHAKAPSASSSQRRSSSRKKTN